MYNNYTIIQLYNYTTMSKEHFPHIHSNELFNRDNMPVQKVALPVHPAQKESIRMFQDNQHVRTVLLENTPIVKDKIRVLNVSR